MALKIRIWWAKLRCKWAYQDYMRALYSQSCGHSLAVRLPSVCRLRNEANRRLKKLVAIDPDYKGPTQII